MRQDINVHSHPSRVEHWRHVIEIVAIVVAALWGFYVFVYQERIKPSTAPPTLTHSIVIQHEPHEGGKELVLVDASFKNIGESLVQIDGMIVNVYGIRYGPKSGEALETPLPGVAKTSFGLKPSAPVPLYSFFDQWPAMGANKGGNLVIEPGLDWHEHFAFAVAKGAYDAASVTFYWCFSPPTPRVWKSPRVRQADGTSMWNLPAEHDPMQCSYQRSGLIYGL